MSKRPKELSPAPPQAVETAVPAKPRAMDSLGLRSPPSKEERAAELLAPLTKDAVEMKRFMSRSVEAARASFETDEDRALRAKGKRTHQEKFEDYLPDLGKMIKASLSALKFYNNRAERCYEEPISPAAIKALEDCAAEIDARIAHQEATAKAEREEMVRAVPRLAARYKAGRRPDIPKEIKPLFDEAVALLLKESVCRLPSNAETLARNHFEDEGLLLPKQPASKQK